MQLAWQTCQGGWCSFSAVDLGHTHFNGMEGVYIIWQENGPVVRVGQGTIRDRLAAHRSDATVTAYGALRSSWAPVASHLRDGVERFLANALQPRVGSAFPMAVPIAVNLPWS